MNARPFLGSRLLDSMDPFRRWVSRLGAPFLRHMRCRAQSRCLNAFLALLLLSVPSGPWRTLAQVHEPVHDQWLSASDRARADTVFFVEHTIADDFDGATSVYAADMDGDGDVDIVGASYFAGRINWWENDGNETFTEHLIAEGFQGIGPVHAADIDADGDADVLGAAFYAGEINWWENEGSETFTKHTIADNRDVGGSVVATDLDADGDLDVLGVSNADQISWWENDGSETFIEHTITDSFVGANLVRAADVDDDGDVDVLGTSFSAGDVSWWENDGTETFTQRPITDSFEGASSVGAADLDSDGDMDVLAAAFLAGEITWWENDGSESFTEHTIIDGFEGANSVGTADVDDDGDVDVLGAASTIGDISWWENDGSSGFTKHTIADGLEGPGSVCASDLDADGDVDVLGVVPSADAINWWEQTENNPPNTPSAPSPANDATDVPIDADLNWIGGDPDSSGDTVTYDVYLGTSSPPSLATRVGPYPATQTSLSYDPGLLDQDTEYFWRVDATDSRGASTEGEVWHFTTEAGSLVYLPLVAKHYPPIPGVPVLRSIDNPDGNGDYRVSWNPVDLADTYTLQEDDNADFSSPTECYSGSNTYWDASGKAPGTYYYRVEASNACGDSGWSNVRSVIVGGPCTPDPPGESDNIDDALTVCSGQTVSGQVSDDDWDDVYKILALTGQQLTISMNGSGGDADLYLYPPDTSDVNEDPYVESSEEVGNDEFIVRTVAEGFWYVDVFSYEGTTNYNVTVTLSGP